MALSAYTAGPTAPTDHESVGALRAENQTLRHAIRHALPALGHVADDPCQPAQRVLLRQAIDELRAALDENRTLL